MSGSPLYKTFFVLMAVWVSGVFSPRDLKGQEGAGMDSATHALTVYVMKSIVPLHWESPSSIYKSVRKGYIKKILHHHQYTLGHMAVRLESPEIEKQGYSGMVSVSQKEKLRLLLKDKIGLAILGTPMQGKIASQEETIEKITLYEKLGKIAFIRFLISREAAHKISLFLEGFERSSGGALPPSAWYGGAFWPRYHGEGAGCTAYVMAMLDVAGLLADEHSNWLISVPLPMELVGGVYNGNKKVHARQVLKTTSWGAISGDTANRSIPFRIFDNNPAYDWIIARRQEIIDSGNPEYRLATEGSIPGLITDKRHIVPQAGEPVFMARPDTSIFIDYFHAINKHNFPLN